MKKATVTIQVEQEKLSAIRFYAGKKDSSIEAELEDFIGKLYEKYVPAQTREYIESMGAAEPEPPKAPPRRAEKQREKKDGEGDAV